MLLGMQDKVIGLKIVKEKVPRKCSVCLITKATKLPYRRSPNTYAPLELVNVDYCGPLNVDNSAGYDGYM